MYYGDEDKGVAFDDYDDDSVVDEIQIPELERAKTAQGEVEGQEGLPTPLSRPTWLIDLDEQDAAALTEIIKERAFGLAAKQIIDDEDKDDELSVVSISTKFGISDDKVEELAAWLATGENDEDAAMDAVAWRSKATPNTSQ